MGNTYKDSGVDYDPMDEFKRKAQEEASLTSINSKYGLRVVEGSRGESAFLMEGPDFYLGHVEEGLGTKNLVADKMYLLTGKSYYDQISQDTVAMIVNDLITLGVMPLSVAMHLAAGSSDWFNDEIRRQDLIFGWSKACWLARCVWGGGETPTLKGIINPETVVLAGSAIGVVSSKERLIDPKNIRVGDAIVLIKSSGIHANGLTMARSIADKLDEGFLTKMEDGRSFGEALLDPTIIYVPLIDDCLSEGINIHYAVNITGHGWRKLMRANENFDYVIDKIFEPQPVFNFIQQHGKVDVKEMYANFNMGAGFALYVDPNDVKKVVDKATSLKMEAIYAGNIVKAKTKKKRIIINPINIKFLGSSLKVR